MPETAYTGSTVGALQDAGLVNSATSSSSTVDVFSVFDALTMAESAVADAQGQATSAAVLSPSAALVGRIGNPSSGSSLRPRLLLMRFKPRTSASGVGRIANPSYDSTLGRGMNPGQAVVIDEVIGTLTDANSDDALFDDLAFEQVSSTTHKARETAAISSGVL